MKRCYWQSALSKTIPQEPCQQCEAAWKWRTGIEMTSGAAERQCLVDSGATGGSDEGRCQGGRNRADLQVDSGDIGSVILSHVSVAPARPWQTLVMQRTCCQPNQNSDL